MEPTAIFERLDQFHDMLQGMSGAYPEHWHKLIEAESFTRNQLRDVPEELLARLPQEVQAEHTRLVHAFRMNSPHYSDWVAVRGQVREGRSLLMRLLA